MVAHVSAAKCHDPTANFTDSKMISVKVLCRDRMKGTWRVVTGLLVFWLLVLLYMSTTLYQTSDVSERTERQLAKALQELDLLRAQNDELAQLAGDLKDIQKMLNDKDSDRQKNLENKLSEAYQKLSQITPNVAVGDRPGPPDGGMGALSHVSKDSSAPSYEHEMLRRKLELGAKEEWYYLRAKLEELKRQTATNAAVSGRQIDMILQNAAGHHRTLMKDLYNLSMSNNHGAWREKEARELSEIVQNRLHYLQNPEDCSKARKLVCNMNKGCGYGCQLHHVVYCFILAYGTERTFVLESRGWRYSPLGWEKVFQPLSQTCLDRSGSSTKTWGDKKVLDDTQVIDLPIVDSLHPRPPFLPMSIPKDLAPRLTHLHGHPFVWWVGQFLHYLLRPSPELEKDIAETTRVLRFSGPIVGVHVRRTDKVGTEAAFHSIEEYMAHVEEYYALLATRQRVDKKRVYLATDEPNLLDEARKKFLDYEFISDNGFSKSAGLSSRYTEASLRAVVLDIHFLSRTDFLVCTFSSQVCRVAYEIMQSLHPDASQRFKSLDDIYYFGGQQGHNQVALEPHQPQGKDEIEVAVGDMIGVAGNHWDGYSKGKNQRTGRQGLYPSYKAGESIRIADFPTYKAADAQLKHKHSNNAR